MKLKPFSDFVVIRPLDLKTSSGIVLIDNRKTEKYDRGTVMAVGPGKFEDGKTHVMNCKVGDVVLFSTFRGEAFKDGDKELVLIRDPELFAKIED
jgi:chaperonin GroES